MLSFTQITIFNVVLFAFLNLIHVEADIAAFTVHNKTQNFRHLPALFGADLHFKDDGLNVGGFLMVAQPEDVCKSIDPPPSNGYVLLVEKPSDCDFDLLVHNAQKARYEAAIVHNVDSNELIRMTYSWRVMLWRMVPNELKSRDLLDRLTLNIPAVFVSEDTARSLTANYTHDKGGYVVLTRTIGDNTNILKECIRIGLSLLSFLIFVSGVLIGAVTLSCIVMCATTFAQYLRQARRHKALLRKLPLHRYKTGDSAGVNECSICLSEFKNGDRLRVLSCSHAHHSKCVDPWLRMKMTCPLCTQKVEGV